MPQRSPHAGGDDRYSRSVFAPRDERRDHCCVSCERKAEKAAELRQSSGPETPDSTPPLPGDLRQALDEQLPPYDDSYAMWREETELELGDIAVVSAVLSHLPALGALL